MFDVQMYFENRSRIIAKLESEGVNSYPHKFHADASIPHLVANFQHLATGVRDRRPILVLKQSNLDDFQEVNEEREISIAGRIFGKRSSGSKLFFYDVKADGASIQIVANRKSVHCCFWELIGT